MTRLAGARVVASALAVGAVLATAAPSAAQWRGWTAYWENDSFVPGRWQTDQAYTNGVRISVAWNPQNNPEWADSLGARWARSFLTREDYLEDSSSPTVSLVFGQNFFTPLVITDFEVDPDDRPYAGLLYAGLRVDLTEEPQELGGGATLTLQHSTELDVGVLGPGAKAEPVQRGVHALRQSRDPKGWHAQQGLDPALQLGYTARARVGWSFLDLVPHVGALAGNPQTVVYGGATARLGVNLTGFPALLIPMNVVGAEDERPDFEMGVLAGVEGRHFFRNAFLDGGLIDDSRSVARKGGVGDLRLGFTMRLTDWRLTWAWIRRTAEVAEGPSAGVHHNYGSLTFGYEPGARSAAAREGQFLGWLMDEVLAQAFENIQLEAGVGHGTSDVPDQGDVDGTGMHVAVGKGLFGNRLILGGEIQSIVRGATGPRTGPPHADEFLSNRVVGVRWRPFGADGFGIFHVRVGYGISATHKVQLVPKLDGFFETCPAGTSFEDDERKRCFSEQSGRGLLLGAGYSISLGRQASAGLDLAYNRLRLEGRTETFFVPALSMRYHPNG